MRYAIPMLAEDGKSVEEILPGIPSRPKEHCDFAWDAFDHIFPRDMLETIENFARLGWSTRVIYRHVTTFFPKGFSMEVICHELMLLAIEYAVRKEKEL